MQQIYLDHTSGYPLDPQVLEAMTPFFTENYGNPASPHAYGTPARLALDEARTRVATLIGAETPEEILFTGGGTESNNLAIKGIAMRNASKGRHLITSAVEHMSVLNPFKYLSTQGFDVTYLPVDQYGVIDLQQLEDALTDQTTLVSIMYANGEIGTIEPISHVGILLQERGIIFHVDAVAAGGKIPINVQEAQIDALTLSSNDLYGPKGVGALYLQSGTRIQPTIQGGGQERGLRSGTENIPGIVGMGTAAQLAQETLPQEAPRLTQLRDHFITTVLETIPEAYLNGHPLQRLPNNINIRFNYIEGEALILSLDMEGVACSSGSACTSKTLAPSHVLLATGLKHEEAHGSLLFTLGKQNKEADIDYVIEILPQIVTRLRQISPLTPKELR
ncbi:MAG: cysteine desulfurase [Candidatus Bathyarchaeota archaeon]|jgi:cysteine desulfurase|nr:cysteine desulfurase [Candidatus Bathyarchaeota archaeon]